MNTRNARRVRRAAGLAAVCAVAFPGTVNVDTDNCVLVTEYGTLLTDPVPNEDNGELFCSTGEHW